MIRGLWMKVFVFSGASAQPTSWNKEEKEAKSKREEATAETEETDDASSWASLLWIEYPNALDQRGLSLDFKMWFADDGGRQFRSVFMLNWESCGLVAFAHMHFLFHSVSFATWVAIAQGCRAEWSERCWHRRGESQQTHPRSFCLQMEAWHECWQMTQMTIKNKMRQGQVRGCYSFLGTQSKGLKRLKPLPCARTI